MKFVANFRKVVIGIFLCLYAMLTILFWQGKTNIFGNVVFSALTILIVLKLVKKLKYNNTFKKFCECFNIMQSAHKTRYYCYFAGTEEEAEEWSEIFKNSSETILNVGPYLIRDKNASRKQKYMVQDMMERTKVLMSTIQPPT